MMLLIFHIFLDRSLLFPSSARAVPVALALMMEDGNEFAVSWSPVADGLLSCEIGGIYRTLKDW